MGEEALSLSFGVHRMQEFKSPPHKLLEHFHESRDKWKVRHHEIKAKLTLAQHQVRAVEKSRAAWRAKYESAERRAEEAAAALENANQRTAEALARVRRLDERMDASKKNSLSRK